ncbi:MAG: hypothetical protein GY862_06100, partial [Gammaproteobacteria bacterium]|nr:hypothetical protein [Gammaproteobacteria bacterium]
MNALKDAIAYLDNQPQDPKTYVSLIRTNLERRNEVLEKIIPPDLAADADYPIITVSLNETFAADAVKLTVYAAKNSGITGGTESSLKRAFLWIRGHEPYEIAYSSLVNQTVTALINGYQGLYKKITLVLETGLHSAITASVPASVQAYISTKDGGNSIPGVNVVGCTNLTSPAAAGELSVDVKDVTTKIAPTIISRAVRSGTHTQPDATLQDIQEQSDITYQEYNGGSYHNHLGDVFSGGGLYPFANFTAPVKSGTFCILNANGTRFDSPAQGHWKSERAAENTYYSSDGTTATLISGDDYDVIFVFLTSGYKPVALLNRAAGVISRLALNADEPVMIPLEAYGRVWMSQIYNDPSDFKFPDYLFRFSAYTDLGQGRIEKQCQALPNAGALTGYSAVLPAGTKLDTLRLVYIREHNGFRYEYQSGAIEELFSDRRVLHGPDTSYIGHFSGMTRLNAFPPKHFVLNDAASYEAGFTVKAVIAEMET